MSKLLTLLTGLLILTPAIADQDINYNLINLSASAKTDVANDEVSATLQVLRNGSDPALLSKEVNKSSQQVLEIAKDAADVDVQTQGYQSQPIYDDGKISSWRVSQQILLESNNFAQMSELLAELQDHANIQSMQFSVSESVLEQTRQTLSEQAIDKFRAQADAVQKQFAMPGYRLVNLSVNRAGYAPRYRETSSMMMADSMMKSAPVAIEAGTNEISVEVHGQIQLISDPSTLE